MQRQLRGGERGGAHLYRQSFVHSTPEHKGGLPLLRSAAVAGAGPRVFARCAVAVTYDNLAWWVEHQPGAEFDQACARLHRLCDELRDELRGET